jgi:tRNA dimethylallyltransferase
MHGVYFIIGPTATGKSELAADIAHKLGAEVVSADAFQIYRGFDLLSGKPDATTLARAPHHLIGTMSILEEMNAVKFRRLALRAIEEICSRDKMAIVVGGSGLYIKSLTHGLSPAPSADAKLRAELNGLNLDDLGKRLVDLDRETARKIDMKNRRRVVRALEICLLSGKPASTQRGQAVARTVGPGQPRSATAATTGIFIFRDRAELHQRINQRVEKMFEDGVVDEVRATLAGDTNPVSATASQMIGLQEIQQHLEGKMSILQCVEKIQQATRQYAKRQLTWFRHQTNFEPLNLSLLTHKEAVERISQRASLVAQKG